VGKRLLALRKAAGLTQRELGAKLSISHSRISYYETGESQIDADALPRFAEALGVGPSAFFEEATEQDPQRATMRQAIEDFLTWRSATMRPEGSHSLVVGDHSSPSSPPLIPSAFAEAGFNRLDPTPAVPDGVLAVA